MAGISPTLPVFYC